MADEYIKKSDAQKLVLTIVGKLFSEEFDIKQEIQKIPSADVAEVVRCKDCRHRDPEDHKCDCGKLERAGCVFPVNDDYFCAYGERMEHE